MKHEAYSTHAGDKTKKKVSCKDMGGTCDATFEGNYQEVMDIGWDHVKEHHPEFVEKAMKMTEEERKKWYADFDHAWVSAGVIE